MAFWNAPLDDPDHAKNAVARGAGNAAKLVELNRGWAAEAGPPATHLIRCAWASASTPANAASAISVRSSISTIRCSAIRSTSPPGWKGLGKIYGVDLVIGEQTAELLADPALIEIDLVAVKGKLHAGRVYTLPSEGSADTQICEPHCGFAEGVSPARLVGGIAPSRRRAARRCSLSGADLRTLPATNRRVPAQGPASRLGRRVPRRREVIAAPNCLRFRQNVHSLPGYVSLSNKNDFILRASSTIMVTEGKGHRGLAPPRRPLSPKEQWL